MVLAPPARFLSVVEASVDGGRRNRQLDGWQEIFTCAPNSRFWHSSHVG